MPLARIITRSQACSRELALDLLARGYRVEIVSPDSLPPDIADLELRVDSGPGDVLTATVEARNGERLASLDFVHHLKTPMADFVRRVPESSAAVYFPEDQVNFNAEPSIAHLEVPAIRQIPVVETRGSQPAAEGAEILTTEVLTTEVRPSDVPPTTARPILAEATIAHAVTAPDTKELSTTIEPTTIEPTTIEPTTIEPKTSKPPTIKPIIIKPLKLWPESLSAEWRSLTAFAVASIALLALILGFAVGRRTTISNPDSSARAAKVETVAGKSEPQSESAHEKPPLNNLQLTSPAEAPQQVANTLVSSGNVVNASRKHAEDFVAPNTVVYLDKRAADAAAARAKLQKSIASLRPKPQKRSGGVIAANSVVYLDSNGNPKPPKTSAAKAGSDPN